MRYAIISDIHANEAALRAVLTDAADAHAEKIVCLGDVLGYGPDPVSTLELVYRRVHVCLAGNHDDAVSNRYPTTDFTPFAAAAVARHRAALSREAIDWLRRLPHVCEFPAIYEGADGAFACAHGDFADPKNFNYVLEPAEAMPSWLERTEQLLFVGHSHKPGIFVLGSSGQPHALEPADFVLEPGKRYLVNVGSVGYPRNGVCRSFYCIYDDLSRAVFFRSLPFDLETYREKMHGQGLDEAPWMKSREKERSGQVADVRSAAHFAKEGKDQGKKIIVLKPLKSAPQPSKAVLPKAAQELPKKNPPKVTLKPRTPEKKAETPPTTTCKLAAPKPLIPPPAPPARPSSGLGPAIVVGALAIAFAAILCTWALLKKSSDVEQRSRPAGTISMNMVQPEASSVQVQPAAPDSLEAQRLPQDWSVTFDHPDLQKVTIEPNSRYGVVAFRIDSQKLGNVTFSKTLSLIEKPPKLYWTVMLLSKATPGQAMNFSFNVRITFYDERGAQVGEALAGGKRSATNKYVTVPPGTTRAMMTVTCPCEGTYDLAVPYFRSEPDERRLK